MTEKNSMSVFGALLSRAVTSSKWEALCSCRLRLGAGEGCRN